MTTPICVSATPWHIRSLVHVLHAKEQSGFRTDSLRCPLFKSLGLMCLSLDGRNTRTTAQRFCLRHREFPVAAEDLLGLT